MASTLTSAMLDANTHAVAGSTRLAATTGGAPIYNVRATANIDNGCIIKRGAYSAPEFYLEEAASASFAAKIIGQAANGNFYVEVTACDELDCLVLSVPLIYEQFLSSNQYEANFFNALGDIMRCYELRVGDVFELSAAGFTGTPVVGKTLTVASKKLVVAD